MTAAKTAAPEFTETGENVSYAVVDGELVIKVDLKHRGGVSASGKTLRIASTGGNKELAPGVFVGLNAYEYVTKR